MQQALQPYATAGVAVVGASLIAVTPVAAPLPGIHAVAEVALTAGEGGFLNSLIAPWADQFNTAVDNATQLANNFSLAPFVGLQQAIVNQADFAQQVLSDTSTIPAMFNQMQENVSDVGNAYTLLNLGGLGLSGGDPVTDIVTDRTLSGEQDLDLSGNTISVLGHKLLFALLPSLLPANLNAEQIQPILNFLASPLSGIIMGQLGPFLSPGVALLNSIIDGDGLNATLANMVGAFFNGADLNLDALAPLIEASGLLPEGTKIYGIDLALGGLLTPGVVASAPNEVYDQSGNVVAQVAAPGGSIFNSLGLNLDASLLGATLPAEVPSHAVGPIGALEGWSQTVGVLLGSGWSGKGNPQPAVPPLSNFNLPIIPDDFFDDGGSGAAAAEATSDLPGWLAQLAGDLGAGL